MSTDPYHAVQHEIQSSLQTAATLRASFLRIRNMAREDSEELVWARNEVSRSSSRDIAVLLIPYNYPVESNASRIRSRPRGFGGEREVHFSLFILSMGIANLCIRIVESTGARMFGLDDAEVSERRRYVGRVRREIQVRPSICPLASFSVFWMHDANYCFVRVGYEI